MIGVLRSMLFAETVIVVHGSLTIAVPAIAKGVQIPGQSVKQVVSETVCVPTCVSKFGEAVIKLTGAG